MDVLVAELFLDWKVVCLRCAMEKKKNAELFELIFFVFMLEKTETEVSIGSDTAVTKNGPGTRLCSYAQGLSCSVHTDNPQRPQRNDTGGKKLTQQVNKRLKHSDTIKRV